MAKDLETATLGRTGLEVTRVGYGCAAIADVSEDVAERMLNLALDAGTNFVDTAIDYGRSEEFIGKFVSQRRSEFYLASKWGCPVAKEPERAHEYTRANIVAGVEQSLARMATDYLDLVQLHSSLTEEMLLEYGVIETLHDLRSEGHRLGPIFLHEGQLDRLAEREPPLDPNRIRIPFWIGGEIDKRSPHRSGRCFDFEIALDHVERLRTESPPPGLKSE